MREARAGQAAKEGKDREDAVLRRAKEEEDARTRSAGTASGGAAPVVDLGPLDKTLKVRWLKARHPTLTTPDAVEAFLAGALAPLRPDIDSVVLSAKTLAAANGTGAAKGKHGSGVVAFRTLSAAVRVVRGKEADPQGVWADFDVDWAAGSPPAALGAAPQPATSAPRPPSPPSAPAPVRLLSLFLLLLGRRSPADSLPLSRAVLRRPFLDRRLGRGLDPRAPATKGAREAHGRDAGRGRGRGGAVISAHEEDRRGEARGRRARAGSASSRLQTLCAVSTFVALSSSREQAHTPPMRLENKAESESDEERRGGSSLSSTALDQVSPLLLPCDSVLY